MKDLHELAVFIANEHSNEVSPLGKDHGASVYYHVLRAIEDNADEIAFVYEYEKARAAREEMRKELLRPWVPPSTIVPNEDSRDFDFRVESQGITAPRRNPLDDDISPEKAALEDIFEMAKRTPDTLSDGEAILTDIYERAKEALPGT